MVVVGGRGRTEANLEGISMALDWDTAIDKHRMHSDSMLSQVPQECHWLSLGLTCPDWTSTGRITSRPDVYALFVTHRSRSASILIRAIANVPYICVIPLLGPGLASYN